MLLFEYDCIIVICLIIIVPNLCPASWRGRLNTYLHNLALCHFQSVCVPIDVSDIVCTATLFRLVLQFDLFD